MSTRELRVPAQLRRGARRAEETASIESAVWLLTYMCEQLGLADLGNSEVFDFGCGVKFTQALINERMPIKRYVGVDVERDMISFLQESVDDPRFEYHVLDARNDLYNPSGAPLTAGTPLPIDGEYFDVICLFSVFTHVAPRDYRILLQLLRRFAKPETQLFFTLYLSERTESGHGLMDGLDRFVQALPQEDLARYTAEHPETSTTIETFRDLDPTKPLTWAMYSETYARELIEGTGWRPVNLSPPDEFIQHHFVCAVE